MQSIKIKNSKMKGLAKEKAVARYLIQQGWTILYQNKKFLNVEIDILAKKKKEHLLIEVKSISKEENLDKILKSKQKERLKQVAQSLCEDFQNLRFVLATVNYQNKIDFFELC